MASDIESIVQEFSERLDKLIEQRLDALTQAKDLRVARHALLQRERTRLTARLGAEHPRVKRLNTRLDANQRIIHALEVQHEVGSATEPEVADTDVLIRGRVVDASGRGIPGVKVALVNSRNQRIDEAGSSVSDASGNYAITINADVAGQITEKQKTGVFISFYNEKDKLVKRRDAALELSAGARTDVKFTLSRNDFQPVKAVVRTTTEAGRPTSSVGPALRPRKKGASLTKKKSRTARIELEAIPGVGKARADKLRAAGIRDAKAFAAADDRKLTEILGAVDVNRLKKACAKLLKK